MPIVEYKFDSIPFTQDEMYSLNEDIMNMFSHKYLIIGACFSGARFVSESFDSYNEAVNEFTKYVDVVRYFDGGSCTLYEYSIDDCEIVDTVLVI